MKRVLILSEPGDVHAHAVAEALRFRGAEPLFYHTPDFPSRSAETVLLENGATHVHFEELGARLTAAPVDAVWRRRPSFAVEEAILHPADREFANQECRIFRHSLFSTLFPEAFWVNPNEGAIRAGYKLLQHQHARQAGLSTPDTLYGNDPAQIRSFLERHDGRIVYKPFRPIAWRNERTSYVPYTSVLTADRLIEDQLLRCSPGIYQALVPKAYELRVTMMGRRAFGAKLLSQETERGKLDWRKSYADLKMEPFDVPREVADACFQLLERLGLVFGCFDFVVTPAQDLVFLEVNEMGQFLFVETPTELPLLDAFCELLLQGSVDFNWDPNQVRVRYRDVREKALALASSSSKRHLAPPDPSVWEGPALPDRVHPELASATIPFAETKGECHEEASNQTSHAQP